MTRAGCGQRPTSGGCRAAASRLRAMLRTRVCIVRCIVTQTRINSFTEFLCFTFQMLRTLLQVFLFYLYLWKFGKELWYKDRDAWFLTLSTLPFSNSVWREELPQLNVRRYFSYGCFFAYAKKYLWRYLPNVASYLRKMSLLYFWHRKEWPDQFI